MGGVGNQAGGKTLIGRSLRSGYLKVYIQNRIVLLFVELRKTEPERRIRWIFMLLPKRCGR